MRTKNLLGIIVCFLVFSLIGVNSPADCKRKTRRSSIPITVEIGTPDLGHPKKKIVPIIMSFYSERINKSVEEFKDCSNKDEFDKQFLSYLEHIEAKELNAIEKRVVIENSDGSLVKGGDGSLESIAKGEISNLSGLGQGKILTKIYFGDQRLYVIEYPNKKTNKKVIRFYRFKKIDRKIFGFGTTKASLHLLLKGYYSKKANNRLPNEKIESYRSKSYKYNEIIYGKKTEHPVRLKFNGKATPLMNIIGEEKGEEFKALSTEYPLISFYRNALMSYVNKDFEAYKDALTPGARNSFKGLSKEFGEDYLRRDANGLKERGRLLYFLLDADPVFYLYYKNKTTKNSPAVSIEVILKTPKNRYKIATSLTDPFLQFIGDQDRFIHPILRPIVQKENNSHKKKKEK